MARQSKGADTSAEFGVDELEKAFIRMGKKYDDKVDALLMAQGRVVTNKTKARTPTGKTKKLKGSWRLKPVKEYGKTKVVRIQSQAPHAHLVEQGHKIVTRERSRTNGRYAKEAVKLGKTSKLTAGGKKAFGVKSGGRVEGKKMLEDTMKEYESKFFSQAQKILNDITSEVEL